MALLESPGKPRERRPCSSRQATGGGASAAMLSQSRCFCELVVLFVGVLTIRALLFGAYFGATDFWKLSSSGLVCQLSTSLDCLSQWVNFEPSRLPHLGLLTTAERFVQGVVGKLSNSK